MGTPEFAVSSLEHLLAHKFQVVAVYTQPDKPGGRGLSLVSSPVKKMALSLGITVLEPKSLKGEAVAKELSSFRPDVVVVVAYARLLPKSVLGIPEFGCLNVHPSLLPCHRGPAPVAAAILNGDEVSGVSIMLMDQGLDTGPIVAQCQIPVAMTDTTASLTLKLSQAAARLLIDVLPRWVAGELTPRPQNEALATYSSPLSRKDSEIDWKLPALLLSRRVRAFQPWPGAYTRWRGRELKILSAVPLPKADASEMGRVIGLAECPMGAPFGIVTGDGILGILSLQLEGRRALPAAEFMRGQREFIGSVLPS